MANNGWRDDERRRWDQSSDRLRGNQFGSPDWQGRDSNSDNRSDEERHRGGNDWQGRQDEYQGRPTDQGRDSDYSSGYATQRHDGDHNLNHRPGGMRYQDGGNDRKWTDRNHYAGANRSNSGGSNPGYSTPRSSFGSSGSYGSGGNYGTSGNYGPTGTYGSNYPSDYQDYGDWQGQGSNDYPRFGGEFNRNAYARGSNYGRNYTGADFAGNASRNPDHDHDRNLWNKATDEVASWAGDQDAQRRREQDRSRGHYGRGPKGYTRSDDRIRDDVHDRLTDDWQLDATNIEVAVKDGEVTLNGTVDSRDDKHRAEHIIESLSGVRHVQNNLRVNESWRSGGATNQHVHPSGLGSSTAGSSASLGSTTSAGTQGRQGSAMGSANPAGSTASTAVSGNGSTGTAGSTAGSSTASSASSTDR